ncbi:MAG: hypothetical protein G4A98_00470 [Buchnera aphidicola (Microlophium carnosum)]|uniref:Outer membrane protein assembly factor BamC n=1 Tax=Buchnera aphidicola (Microlophium carnosum) TaxID=2708354 RepID=A0A6G9JU03_9GAMM|nr:MAG: hypothetical protein G4A98_00470 [Buchnera aphidicola (Microlophium carnosum)]
MLILKYYRTFFKKTIIFQILNIFLITSCTLKDFKKNDDFDFYNTKNQFKKLIVPKGISIPDKKEEYSIPYTDKDLEKKNHDIFPPI